MYFKSKKELNYNRLVDPNILGASHLVHSHLRIYRMSFFLLDIYIPWIVVCITDFIMAKQTDNIFNITSLVDINPSTTKLHNLNFYPHEVASRCLDPQLQVGKT